jgi:RNA polymerase sigma-70 factor (ECF subfamily)
MEKLTPERRQWIADHVLPWEPQVRNWLRRYTRISPDEIDDFIQEAYSRLCSVDFRRITDARRFFQRIVRNRVIDERRRARIVEIECLEEIASLPIEEPLGLERVVSARQDYERVLKIIKHLSLQQRAVFELREFQDLSVKEIARYMGIDKKTVRTHLQRAHAHVLRAMYGAEVNTTYRASGVNGDQASSK